MLIGGIIAVIVIIALVGVFALHSNGSGTQASVSTTSVAVASTSIAQSGSVASTTAPATTTAGVAPSSGSAPNTFTKASSIQLVGNSSGVYLNGTLGSHPVESYGNLNQAQCSLYGCIDPLFTNSTNSWAMEYNSSLGPGGEYNIWIHQTTYQELNGQKAYASRLTSLFPQGKVIGTPVFNQTASGVTYSYDCAQYYGCTVLAYKGNIVTIVSTADGILKVSNSTLAADTAGSLT
jgi:hypothetical protein